MFENASAKVVTDETLEILKEGKYHCRDISSELKHSVSRTRTFSPSDLATLVELPKRTLTNTLVIEVTGEKTQDAVQRLYRENLQDVLVLNFASPKNPGGGFVRGTVAQEEDLCRSSGLYLCLTKPESSLYFEENRAFINKSKDGMSNIYTDWMIHSPHVPFFRSGNNRLTPFFPLVDVITCAAPHARALANGVSQSDYDAFFMQRIQKVLALAEHVNAENLILGAWGCGVFENNPESVAKMFKQALHSDRFKGSFEKVVFAVYDKNNVNTEVFSRVFSEK